jgi:hypothetical protein
MSGAPSSEIDTATLQAYEETEFRVFGSSPTVLTIGRQSPDLAQLHKSHAVGCSAFITAYNPFSAALDDVANAKRQASLAEELRQRSLGFVDGVGQHPSNEWPGEPSFLVFGLTLEAAKVLGRRLEQNAIVWSGPEAVPELVLLR